MNPSFFCYFSGYATQNFTVTNIEINSEQNTIALTGRCASKIKISTPNYIQLDGVIFMLLWTLDGHACVISTLELCQKTTLMSVKINDKLHLSKLAVDEFPKPCWMLEPTAKDNVTFLRFSVLDGHNHTLKFDFSAPIHLSEEIHDNAHIGLAGASLTVQELRRESNALYFSIYCGNETREKTIFNAALVEGSAVNITLPGKIFKP